MEKFDQKLFRVSGGDNKRRRKAEEEEEEEEEGSDAGRARRCERKEGILKWWVWWEMGI